MIRHGMDLVIQLTKVLNSEQKAVMCLDLQLYIIAKKIQWHWPDLYGEREIVLLLGPLHIEQAFLRMLGEYMEGCGWTTIITHSGIATSGSAEALMKVTHIKRAREAHQITAAVLHCLLMEEFTNSHPEGGDIELQQWIDERVKLSPTFLFWFTLLNLEIMLLDFVRSVRLGHYSNFKEALKAMAPCWKEHAQVFTKLFQKVSYGLCCACACENSYIAWSQFVVNKTNNLFSSLGIDHAHEQNNASVKGKGGISGLTHDPSALRRWTIGGPEITRILNEFENEEDDDDTGDFGSHHEQKESYQMRFLQHCIALKDSFHEFDNPFSLNQEELIALDTRVAISAEGVAALVGAKTKGSKLYTDFVNERLLERTKSLYDPITKCNTKIFAAKKKPSKCTAVDILKSEVNLFSRSFVVSIARKLDLDKFFEYENLSYPPSLAVGGKMRTGDKNQLTLILETLGQNPQGEVPTQADAAIIDGGCLVHAVKPRPDQKTFTEYVKQLLGVINFMVSTLKVQRVDIAWDRYLKHSLKEATRTDRGQGKRRVDLPAKDKLPPDWEDYLRDDQNKVELFRYLSQALLEKCEGIQMVTNVDSKIISSVPGNSSLHGASAEMEEADGRVILHLQDMVVHGGSKTVVVRSTDTDVLVLLVSFFPKLRDNGLQKLWVNYGSKAKRRFISIHGIASKLGDMKSVALRGFHAFTGSDVTAFFGSKGKRSAWNSWTTEETTVAFKRISDPLSAEDEIDESIVASIERFVISMYGVKGDK
ncbi:hypothetical protein FOCC_FOCC013765, partial [Frankliniella occidentalis]